MAIQTITTTYTQVRQNLAEYLNRVADDGDVVIVQRRAARDVALIPADELESLMETAHLLRSPANAERLLAALARAKAGEGTPMCLEDLKREVGFVTAK